MAFLDETGLAHFWNQILARLNNFVPAEAGKGLSSNDYTTAEKEKLAGITEGANNYVLPVATSSTLGGVKGGVNIEIDSDGVMSIPDGNIGTSKFTNGAVTRVKLASDVKVLSFTNKTVATSAWVSDTTYDDFPYRAAIVCEGVTAKHYVEVTFAPADALSGSFAPVAASYDGGVYIYTSEIPEAALTIPTIVCTPVE